MTFVDEQEEVPSDMTMVAEERVAEIEEQDLAPSILQLRDYQRIGSDWLRVRRRAMLTDQPGLGKTLQSATAAEKPVLVCAPTYLTKQWAAFLTEQFPDDEVVLARGSRRKRRREISKNPDWLVINHQMLRTFDLEYFDDYRTIILDECHHFKNRKSQQARAAAALCEDMTKRVYMLSATPMWKSVDDIWMQLHILQPQIFDSYTEFVDTFCVVDEDPWNNIKVLGVKKSMRKDLEELLSIVRLGRTYKDVGRALPQLIEKTVSIEMPPELLNTYNELKRSYRMQFVDEEGMLSNMLFTSYAAVMHSLRQITAWPGKVDAVIDMLEDVATGPDASPTLIFCWYKESAELLYNAIQRQAKAKGFRNVEMITGDIKDPEERRQRALNGHIVIATISSLSEGVNMYHARTVAFFEEHYVPGSNYQALSRVRRDRNDDGADTTPVVCYYFHSDKTIDQIIHRISRKRGSTIKDLMSEVMN